MPLTTLVYSSVDISDTLLSSLHSLSLSVCIVSVSFSRISFSFLCLVSTLELSSLCSILVVQQSHLGKFFIIIDALASPQTVWKWISGAEAQISLLKKKKLFKGGRSLDALLVRMQNGSTSVEVNLTKFNKTAYAFTLQPGIITSRILPWSHTPNNTKYLCTSYVHCRIINLNAYKCSLMLFLLEIL